MMSPAPLVLSVAPNGARRTKADHPALPMTAAESARAARAAMEAGATLLHLHVRDRDGRHSLDADLYRDAIGEVRAAVGAGMVIQITTEAVGRYSPEDQRNLVRALRPEAVSIALREIVPDETEERLAAVFFAWLSEQPTAPQIILYEPSEVARLADLRRRGIIPFTRLPVLFVLGRYASSGIGDPADLLPFLAAARGDDPWTVCCFGPTEFRAAAAAIALGGHMRLGFENNLTTADGIPLADNAASIAIAADLAMTMGRRLATVAETRALVTAEAAPVAR
jgi:uncharacterized protein (DUF849 family)